MNNQQRRLYSALVRSRLKAIQAIAKNATERAALADSLGNVQMECLRTALESKDPAADFALFFPAITGQHNNRTGSNLDVHQRTHRRNAR